MHKWFARRPGTLFRGLALSEFSTDPLAETFFRANDFPDKQIADPFMGGGTPLIECNRIGCDVFGYDINPMSAWIVREEMEHLNLDAYQDATRKLAAALRDEIQRYYLTNCPLYGDTDVPVKYFLWVKVLDCKECRSEFDLFPGYLLSENKRHPQNILVCPDCGGLNEVADTSDPGACHDCGSALCTEGPAHRNHCPCPNCGHVNSYPETNLGPPRHRLFAIEYYNPYRQAEHKGKGRLFKKPDHRDLARLDDVETRWNQIRPRFVPNQEIPPGDETGRLHKWGYSHYKDMFNSRQLLGLELSCRIIDEVDDQRIRYALATNVSDLLRYQNMLCRYDTMALKSLDIFSIHGFPVGLIQCESNLLGIDNG